MEQSKMIIKRNLLFWGKYGNTDDSHPDWICFAVRFVFQYG